MTCQSHLTSPLTCQNLVMPQRFTQCHFTSLLSRPPRPGGLLSHLPHMDLALRSLPRFHLRSTALLDCSMCEASGSRSLGGLCHESGCHFTTWTLAPHYSCTSLHLRLQLPSFTALTTHTFPSTIAPITQLSPITQLVPSGSPEPLLVPSGSPEPLLVPSGSPEPLLVSPSSPSSLLVPPSSPSSTLVPLSSPSSPLAPPSSPSPLVPSSVALSERPLEVVVFPKEIVLGGPPAYRPTESPDPPGQPESPDPSWLPEAPDLLWPPRKLPTSVLETICALSVSCVSVSSRSQSLP